MLREFRDFVVRGNVLDLAVAFIMGVAFANVVNAFADHVLMAAVAAVFGEPNFGNITITVGDGVIGIGILITAVVNLLIIAAGVFAIVKVAAAAQARRATAAEDEAPVPSDEALILAEIRDLLRSGAAGPR